MLFIAIFWKVESKLKPYLGLYCLIQKHKIYRKVFAYSCSFLFIFVVQFIADF